MNQRISIANADIDNVTMASALDRIETLIADRVPSYAVTPNVDHVVLLASDPEFRSVYENANLVLPDGMPLIWASKFLGSPLQERVTGADLLPAFGQRAACKGYRVFLLGGDPGAAEKARLLLEKENPGLQVVGTSCPPLGFHEEISMNDRVIHEVRAAEPDILFVALGTPKQEKWIGRYCRELQVPFVIGVGAAFDFLAGIQSRAPIWMQRVGLEWFYRLLKDPRRLWRRYLVNDPKFFGLILKQKWGRKKKG